MTALQWLTVAALSPLIVWALMYVICFALMCIGFVYGKVRRWIRKAAPSGMALRKQRENA